MTKPVTRKMAVDCLLYLSGGKIYCYLCGAILEAGQSIQFDHVHADVFGGPHEHLAIRPVHAQCHKEKTKRDVKANAKIKRIIKKREHPKPKRLTKSRGFDKRYRKKMDGTLVRR